MTVIAEVVKVVEQEQLDAISRNVAEKVVAMKTVVKNSTETVRVVEELIALGNALDITNTLEVEKFFRASMNYGRDLRFG